MMIVATLAAVAAFLLLLYGAIRLGKFLGHALADEIIAEDGLHRDFDDLQYRFQNVSRDFDSVARELERVEKKFS